MVFETKEINPNELVDASSIELNEDEKRKLWTKSHTTKMSPWGDISSAANMPLSMNDDSNFDNVEVQLEYIINWAVETYGQEAFSKAKKEFYLLAGKFFYDDTNYNQRVHYFLDYFLFERKMSDHLSNLNSESPYYEFINSDFFALSKHADEIKKSILDFRGSKHSIFVVKKSNLSELTIVDLLTNEKIKVTPMEGQTFQGLDKGQVFQSFIYSWKGSNLLSKGIVLHPCESWSVIIKTCKLHRKNQNNQSFALISKLAKLQIESKIRKPQAIKMFYQNALS